MSVHGTAGRLHSGSRVARLFALAGVALLALGARCGGGDGSGGRPSRVEIGRSSLDCAALFSEFPPGYDFVPGPAGAANRVLAASFSPSSVVLVDVSAPPYGVAAGAASLILPDDADGDGIDEGGPFLPAPQIDDVFVLAADLAVVTTSGYEALLFVDPVGAMRTVEVAVPATAGANDFPRLPAPGTSALRTGVANFHCIDPSTSPLGARDSRGALLVDVLPPLAACPPPRFRTGFTAGAAYAPGAARLFVAMSNVGADAGTPDTQYLPGAILVYDFDPGVSPPRLSARSSDGVIFTTGFNPTHVTSWVSPGGRELVLVNVTGAIGIVEDDPTTSALEGGTTRITQGAIDVIDANTLELVATIPLGLANPAFRGVTIDPSDRIGLVGDVADRLLYAIDLAPLDSLPASVTTPVVLDGTSAPRAAIFDASLPFVLPAFGGGAPEAVCPGRVDAVAFDASGTRARALESCNGILAAIDVDLAGPPPVPVPPDRFRFVDLESITAPLRADRVGEPQQPSALRTRPGVPGVDFVGNEMFFTIGTPEGELCGLVPAP